MSFDYEAAFREAKEETKQGLSDEKKAQLRALTRRDPLDPAPLLEGFAHYEPMVTQMEDEAKAVTVVDDQTSANCTEMAGQTRKLYNEVEKARKASVEPYNGVVKVINGTVKVWTERLLSLQRLLEGKNRGYLVEQDRKRREAEAKAQAEAERLRKEAEAKAQAEAEAKAEEMGVPVEDVPIEPVIVSTYIPPSETAVKTDSGSQKVDYEYEPTLVNVKLLSDACLEARWKQIEAAVLPWARAQIKAGATSFPGFTVQRIAKVKTRAGR